MPMGSRARAGFVAVLIAGLFPRLAAAEGAVGRVTFVGTLSDERLPDGSVQARFRFRLSESSCGTTGGLWTRRRTGANWSAWEPLPAAPVPLTSDPAAIARGPSRIDLFVLGSDNHIYWINWNGAQWSGWTVVPGPELLSSAPGVASRGPNSLDLFARGAADTALQRNIWNGSAWSGWRQVSTVMISSRPAAVARGPNRMDVFARQFDNTMRQITWTGTWAATWPAVSTGLFNSGPAAVAEWWQVVDRMDVFALGTDNALYASASSGTDASGGTAWSGWARVSPEPMASDPAAVSLQLTQTEVFARRPDNRMSTIVWTGTPGSTWTPLGEERFSGGPAAVSMGGQIHLFTRGSSRADRWIHARSGRMDGASQHVAANFRNAYNTLLSAFLARSVANVQVDGVPSCDETQTQTISLPGATIGLLP